MPSSIIFAVVENHNQITHPESYVTAPLFLSQTRGGKAPIQKSRWFSAISDAASLMLQRGGVDSAVVAFTRTGTDNPKVVIKRQELTWNFEDMWHGSDARAELTGEDAIAHIEAEQEMFP